MSVGRRIFWQTRHGGYSQCMAPPKDAAQWDPIKARLGNRAGALAALGELAAEDGVAALLVGGCVRDLLRQHTPNDLDVVVVSSRSNAAARLAGAAASALGGRASGNPAFGTAHWVTLGGDEIDLASARTEHYTAPGALPTVASTADLTADLHRRDFTINTMAIDLSPDTRGRLVDPFGGRADLAAGVLRVLHDDSFRDDPTRIFRAARFAARLDLTLAPGTAALLAETLRAPITITLQRVGAELDRIFAEERLLDAVALLDAWGVLAWIEPELQGGGLAARLERTVAAWAALSGACGAGEPPLEALWLTLARSLSASARERCADLVAGARGRRARWLEGPAHLMAAAAALSDSGAARAGALRGLDEAELVVLAADGAAAAVSWWLSVGRHIPLPVDGRLLLSRGARPGPRMGRAIAAARDVAWNGGDEAAQIEAAMRILASGD